MKIYKPLISIGLALGLHIQTARSLKIEDAPAASSSSGAASSETLMSQVTNLVTAELESIQEDFDGQVLKIKNLMLNLGNDGDQLKSNFNKLRISHKRDVRDFKKAMARLQDKEAIEFEEIEAGLPDVASCQANAFTDSSWHTVTSTTDGSDRFWKIFSSTASRATAQENCENLGPTARLAEIRSVEMRTEMYQYSTSKIGDTPDFWIGGKAENSCSSTASFKWADGVEVSSGGGFSNKGNSRSCCIAMDGDESPWSHDCSSYLGYVCEATCT